MRLLWGVDHGLQRVSKRMRHELGVTGPQRLVIRAIGQFPGLSAGGLAELLHLHPSTLTGVLARLDAGRLLSRISDPADRRRVILTLTARGRAVDRLRRETAEAVVRSVLDRSTVEEFAAAVTLLGRLADALNTVAEPPGPRRRSMATSGGSHRRL